MNFVNQCYVTIRDGEKQMRPQYETGDISAILSTIDSSSLCNHCFYITGATGLIGQYLVKTLLTLSETRSDIRIIANVRDIDKARNCFKDYPDNIEYDICDIKDITSEDKGIDYILHCASNTSSKAFVEQPVSIIEDNVLGTMRIIELAKANNIKKLIYLSTMEIYGNPIDDTPVTEGAPSNLDILSSRSSYPESKRLCETLCASSGIPFCSVRLTQTIGPGIAYNDGRVFAEFSRCVVEHKDIVLKTKGLTKRDYIYLADAITAIFTILIKGTSGEAYNVANEESYCSIREMAECVIETFAPELKVIIDETGCADRGFCPTMKMNLSSNKLRTLGWAPAYDLMRMYEILISYLRDLADPSKSC